MIYREKPDADCRKCKNCDMENDRCKLYGDDPDKATRACAEHRFRGYRPKGINVDDKRLADVLARVDDEHFAVIENDCAELYSKKEFYATPTPKPDEDA